jgi:hypothetical protein
MNQATAKIYKTPFGDFTFVTGKKSEEVPKSDLPQLAWQFAYSVLWNNQVFSSTEIRETKQRIKRLLCRLNNPQKTFVSFCQRVVLARQHIETMSMNELAFPSLWFNVNNREGYARTKAWMNEIRAVRRSLPNFQKPLRALGEAVLEFSEAPTEQNYRYWRDYFIDKDEPVLLHIFTVYCANRHFKIQ